MRSALAIAPCLMLCACAAGAGAGKVRGELARAVPPASPPTTRATVDFARLLGEMVDLSALARFPEPPYRTGTASSYDRDSQTPNTPGWFANRDRGQFVAEIDVDGRHERVLAELDGPGVITRIWSANPSGTLRIYIDRAARPALVADMKRLLGGEVAGFPPPLAHVAARGYNLYFPIGFQRHCLVTTDDGADLYYQVSYRSYHESVVVEPFAMDIVSRSGAAIEAVRAVLAAPERSYQPAPEVAPERVQLTKSSDTLTIAADAGGSAIRRIVLTPNAPDAEALRAATLSIAFDGAPPSVDLPLGAFFGPGPAPMPQRSLPLSVHKDGQLDSRWVMPFARTASLRVAGAEVAFDVEAWVEPVRFDADRSMHFHAARVSEAGMSTAEPFDWTYLEVAGRGVYAGNALDVWNPVEAWWGEGDEKIYVDGEHFPSHFGTGTEDYYGYAWCSPERFDHAYHGQTRVDGPKNRGHTANHRFHVLDAIPFERALRFDMEIRHWKRDVKLDYEVVNYWYEVP